MSKYDKTSFLQNKNRDKSRIYLLSLNHYQLSEIINNRF